ncbi:hypothetical protein [Kribbella sp. NBC_00889]|uniref:hypothetical protein n=1 Tax=Kribbella sp. NBC_00889 TaxID=2975974 RepID=UPI003869091D|nr:hypothetical protein OG817_00035 [Kribbella sp. NBC_00889]
MNTQHKNPATSRQHTNEPAATITKPTIQQPPAGSNKTKELRSHLGITIKWSVDSASRRRIGLPPAAGGGAGAQVIFGGAAWL